MREPPVCPICRKRRAERFCPAKGESICAVCCAQERENAIDCPSDCSHLIAAHRWEEERRKPLAESEFPFPEVAVSPDLIHEQRVLVTGLSLAILGRAAEDRALMDSDLFAALSALAETYRTLGAGLYYENPPPGAVAHGLYSSLAKYLKEWKEKGASEAGAPHARDTEIFPLLVFLLRIGRSRSNGRPRTRGFLDFLRAQFPQTQSAPEAPRIIAP
ncbi:MAG: B-box zinc finger protein [Candidatus Acidiferrales bacterium]